MCVGPKGGAQEFGGLAACARSSCCPLSRSLPLASCCILYTALCYCLRALGAPDELNSNSTYRLGMSHVKPVCCIQYRAHHITNPVPALCLMCCSNQAHQAPSSPPSQNRMLTSTHCAVITPHHPFSAAAAFRGIASETQVPSACHDNFLAANCGIQARRMCLLRFGPLRCSTVSLMITAVPAATSKATTSCDCSFCKANGCTTRQPLATVVSSRAHQTAGSSKGVLTSPFSSSRA